MPDTQPRAGTAEAGDKLRDAATRIAVHYTGATDGTAIGSGVLELILSFVIPMLRDCLGGGRSPARVARRAKRLGLFERAMILHRAREAAGFGNGRRLQQATLLAIEEAGERDIEEVAAAVQAAEF